MTYSKKFSDSSKVQKEEWKCYPNKLAPQFLNSSRHKLEDKFPGWYQFLQEGDRVKLRVPGNTPATLGKTFLTYGWIQFIGSACILLNVESWSGFGTFKLTIYRTSKEKILWHAAGTSARILKRMHKYKKLQSESASF